MNHGTQVHGQSKKAQQRIKELETELAHLEEALQKRHPDSIAALIRATKPEETQRKKLEERVRQLEQVRCFTTTSETRSACDEKSICVYGQTECPTSGARAPPVRFRGLKPTVFFSGWRSGGGDGGKRDHDLHEDSSSQLVGAAPYSSAAQELEQEREQSELKLRGLQQRFASLKSQYAAHLDTVRRLVPRIQSSLALPSPWTRSSMALDLGKWQRARQTAAPTACHSPFTSSSPMQLTLLWAAPPHSQMGQLAAPQQHADHADQDKPDDGKRDASDEGTTVKRMREFYHKKIVDLKAHYEKQIISLKRHDGTVVLTSEEAEAKVRELQRQVEQQQETIDQLQQGTTKRDEAGLAERSATEQGHGNEQNDVPTGHEHDLRAGLGLTLLRMLQVALLSSERG